MEPVIRPARLPDEAERLAREDWRAFREGTPESWIAYYRDNPHVRHRDGVLVAEQGGEHAGQCALMRLELAFAGATLPIWGVAAVGVAPEARRRKVADALMHDALRRMRKAGVAVAVLYPFSTAYYRRFGYEQVEAPEVLAVRPSRLPDSPHRKAVRRLVPARDGAAIEALYERLRRDPTRAGLLARSRWWWDARIYKRVEEWLGVPDGRGGLAGVLAYSIPAAPTYPHQVARVTELWAETPAAHAGLVAAMAALGEQIVRVELPLPRGHGAPLLVENGVIARSPERVGVDGVEAQLGAMARLVDVPAALALHPRATRPDVRGTLGLDVADPSLPARSLDVTFSARGTVARPGRTARARLALSVGRLAQVYFGFAPATQLVAQGLATGDGRAAALLDAALAGPPLFLGPGNAF